MRILGIIPARYSSTRFPGKPLVNIGGKSMIRWVYEAASRCKSLDLVVVATDDTRIEAHVVSFGGTAILTSPDHASGTERCWEAAQKCGVGYDGLINIQGDEPFIDPAQIETVAECLLDPDVTIATLMKKISNSMEIENPNVVKVVIDKKGNAIFFSRATIPFVRGSSLQEWTREGEHYKHIGIYGYRLSTLQELVALPVCRLEKMESLEQLRWLWHGYEIRVAETTTESIAIDTPADLLKITNTAG